MFAYGDPHTVIEVAHGTSEGFMSAGIGGSHDLLEGIAVLEYGGLAGHHKLLGTNVVIIADDEGRGGPSGTN